jgi:hypothetical protein
MENLRFNIAAGETKVFVKAGRYFEILESSGPVTLGFYDQSGNQNNDATNVLSGTYVEDSFSQFDISSPTAQTVEILISDGKGGTRRQPGVVAVVDAGKARTLANQAFMARVSNVSGAGQYVTAQLFMPAGASRRAVVSGVTFSNSVAASVFLTLTSTAQAALGSVTQGASKLGGGAASVATTQGILAATLPGVGFVDAQIVYQASVQAGVAQTVQFKEPVVLPPGWGLMILANATGGAQTLSGAFEFIEESVM